MQLPRLLTSKVARQFWAPLLALSLASPILAQQPGKPSDAPSDEKPATKAEKLKQSKDAFAGAIDAGAIDIGPGPVDERLKKYFKELKIDGAGFYKDGDKDFLVAYGESTITNEIKPGWVERRIVAFAEAELKGRAAMAKAIQQSISSGQFYDRFEDYSKDATDQLKALKDNAVSGDTFSEATATFAASQVVGAVTFKTIEGENKDKEYKVIKVLMWSPNLRDTALDALADSDYFLPATKLQEGEADLIPETEEELVKEIGCQVYMNEAGQRYYVAFGQAEPIVRNQAGASRAVQVAQSLSENRARGYLARALAAEVTASDLATTAKVFEEADDGKTDDKLVRGFYEQMASVSENIKLTGVIAKKKWTYQHPGWKQPVVGTVVVWSPQGRSMVKELGLNSRVDLTPEKLAAFLTEKYGKPNAAATSKTTAGGAAATKGKPGAQESKGTSKSKL